MIEASKTVDEHKYDRIMVSDVLSQESEVNSYIDMAKDHGYYFFSMVVENRHDGDVNPEVTRANMEAIHKRFDLKLFK